MAEEKKPPTMNEEWEKLRSFLESAFGENFTNHCAEWARLMEEEVSLGKSVSEVALKMHNKASFTYSSPAMMGTMVLTLKMCWVYGEQLAEWFMASQSGI
jgi:hypothetical protein